MAAPIAQARDRADRVAEDEGRIGRRRPSRSARAEMAEAYRIEAGDAAAPEKQHDGHEQPVLRQPRKPSDPASPITAMADNSSLRSLRWSESMPSGIWKIMLPTPMTSAAAPPG